MVDRHPSRPARAPALPKQSLTMNTFLQAPPAEMADIFRSEGKMLVVLVVLGIVFVGLVAYLIWMDRRIKKLEQKP
jgi:CcmD family protein